MLSSVCVIVVVLRVLDSLPLELAVDSEVRRTACLQSTRRPTAPIRVQKSI